VTSDQLNRAVFCALAFCVISVKSARAQGGPPMITDDPGTPGPGKWEINLAIAFEHRSDETSYDLPAIDLNYGVGDRIQLTLETTPVLLKRDDHGPIGGLGGTETAVKWRFLNEEKSGFDVSMFPRIIFNIQQSSARRGLADNGTRFQIPFQIAKTFGRFHADAEFGPVGITVGRSEWLYGVVGGFDVAKPTMLMAELHGTSRMNFSQQVVTLNFGVRQTLTERCIFIGSLGHEVLEMDDEPLAFIGYFGVQLLY
jgi:hypothetical protein